MILAFNKVLDATGLTCPEPVMLLHGTVRDALPGDIIKVVATDPSTQRDIVHFCEFLGHELLQHEHSEETYIYWVKKRKSDSI